MTEPRSTVAPADLPTEPVAIPTALHHVRLTVTDIRASKAFYSAVFGLEPAADQSDQADDPAVREDPARLYGGCVFQVGSQLLGLRPVAPKGEGFVAESVGLDHVSLAVGSLADLQAAADRLAASQITHGELVRLEDFGMAIVSIQDPDGINLELTAAL